jgi:hypothetical protein
MNGPASQFTPHSVLPQSAAVDDLNADTAKNLSEINKNIFDRLMKGRNEPNFSRQDVKSAVESYLKEKEAKSAKKYTPQEVDTIANQFYDDMAKPLRSSSQFAEGSAKLDKTPETAAQKAKKSYYKALESALNARNTANLAASPASDSKVEVTQASDTGINKVSITAPTERLDTSSEVEEILMTQLKDRKELYEKSFVLSINNYELNVVYNPMDKTYMVLQKDQKYVPEAIVISVKAFLNKQTQRKATLQSLKSTIQGN